MYDEKAFAHLLKELVYNSLLQLDVTRLDTWVVRARDEALELLALPGVVLVSVLASLIVTAVQRDPREGMAVIALASVFTVLCLCTPSVTDPWRRLTSTLGEAASTKNSLSVVDHLRQGMRVAWNAI